MPEVRLRQPGLVLVDYLLKIIKHYQNFKKQEKEDTFIKDN